MPDAICHEIFTTMQHHNPMPAFFFLKEDSRPTKQIQIAQLSLMKKAKEK